MSGAHAVRRGCGRRVAGGVYAEVGLSPDGLPIEAFLMDPPVEIPEHLHLAPQGVAWVERAGVWHLVDWVGSQHYPNVADFIEEARRFGLSRRVPKNAPFERLTPASRILLVHARAMLPGDAMRAYRPAADAPHPCPLEVLQRMGGADPLRPRSLVDDVKVAAHRHGETLCAGVWWEDVEGGTPNEEHPRMVWRQMPSFAYQGLARPADIPAELEVCYEPGFFASFPLSRLAVVRDQAAGSHVLATEAARRSGLTVEEVDE